MNAQTAVTNGYKDFSFGTTGTSAPTGEKPESKLWYTPDGTWWGVLYNNAAQAHRIYRFQPNTQSWSDTGVTVDDRNSTKSDVLWHPATSKLYVASHTFSTAGKQTSSASWGRVYRFSYNSATNTYTRDTGFPVTVTTGKSETLTLAKDTTGKLWVTYVESNKVYVNRSGSSETSWGTPFVVPVDATTTNVSADDISAIVAFGGGKVGIMWSNQVTSRFYFAVHGDGAADTAWSLETPITGPTGLADDHVHLKASADGRVFAAVKTSFTVSTDPLVKLLVRSPGGIWSDYTFGRKSDHHTRPILVLNEGTRTLYLFGTSGESGGAIYYKQTDMDNPSFAVGLGIPFIQSTTENNVNDATTTGQSVTAATGLLVAGSNNTNRTYYHASIGLGAIGNTPTITSLNPASGTVGTSVVITGTNFTGATSVSFAGTSATFTVNSNTNITATVPSGTQTGKVVVETPNGTATSAADFTVTTAPPAPVISSFSPTSGPAATQVTITGSNFTGATAVRFGSTEASFSVVNSTTINATVPNGATSGSISVETPAGTATSGDTFTVTTAPPAQPTISSFTPTSGPVGTQVTISGSNFTGATSVTINGVAAVFSVSNGSTITATIPSTTTGKISVTTPGGTATSSDDFTVTTPTPVARFQPFGTVTVQPAFQVNGQGTNVDSIAFWEAPNPTDSLMFVTAKANQRVEVWKYPYVNAEQVPLQHSTFGAAGTQVNGIVVDQETDRLYVAVSAPVSTVSVFALPSLQFVGEFISGAVDLKSEPNLALLQQLDGQKRLYVSADTVVYIHDVTSGARVGQFTPAKGLEAMIGDPLYKVLQVPDESTRTGIYAYHPDGTPYRRGTTSSFGSGVFQSDGEGVAIYTCPSDASGDNGTGLIIASDQRSPINDFEVFNRQTWEYLGTIQIAGVSNTDGIASTQQASSNHPLGLFAALNNDTSVAAVGWDTILAATGISCGTSTTPPSPSVAAFSPSGGPIGTQVTIAGTGLGGATGVAFGGTPATTFSVDSSRQITATVPNGANTGSITVNTPDGAVTSPAAFTVTVPVPSPVITSFTPASGPVGTQVTITGTNLSNPSSVKFNGVNATAFSGTNSTTVTATVPASATSGTISIETAGGIATSAETFTVTSAPTAPTISSFAPTSGPVGTQVTINGTNFTGTTGVTFNGVAATYTVVDASSITATVPSTTSGTISVTTPEGTATTATAFTVTSSTPGTQTWTLNPQADSYVRGGTYANTNFGTATILNVRTSTVLDNYRDTYIKYDLAAVNNVTSAKLRFASRMGTTTSAATEVRTVADSSWTETGITYATRPALGSVLGTVMVSGTTYVWYEVDVTAYVQAELAAGRTTISLAVHNTTDSGTYQNIYAKEFSLTNATKMVVVGSE